METDKMMGSIDTDNSGPVSLLNVATDRCFLSVYCTHFTQLLSDIYIKSNQIKSIYLSTNQINRVDRTPRKVKPSLTDAPNNRIGITHKHDGTTTQLGIYTVSQKKHVTTFSTITLTISVRLQ